MGVWWIEEGSKSFVTSLIVIYGLFPLPLNLGCPHDLFWPIDYGRSDCVTFKVGSYEICSFCSCQLEHISLELSCHAVRKPKQPQGEANRWQQVLSQKPESIACQLSEAVLDCPTTPMNQLTRNEAALTNQSAELWETINFYCFEALNIRVSCWAATDNQRRQHKENENSLYLEGSEMAS